MPEEEIGVVNEKEEETEVIPEGAVEEELVHNVRLYILQQYLTVNPGHHCWNITWIRVGRK